MTLIISIPFNLAVHTSLPVQPTRDYHTQRNRIVPISKNRLQTFYNHGVCCAPKNEIFQQKKNIYSSVDKSWLQCQRHQNFERSIMTPEDLEKNMQDPPAILNWETLNRVKGSMFGIALGDSLGAHVEFRPRSYLEDHPVTDLQGGGTWGLKKGQVSETFSF